MDANVQNDASGKILASAYDHSPAGLTCILINQDAAAHTVSFAGASGQNGTTALWQQADPLKLTENSFSTLTSLTLPPKSVVGVCWNNSTPSVAKPVITPNGGVFASSVSVTLSTSTSGAAIYYTTNGTDPTSSSTRYTAPFSLTASATVKAIGIKSGLANSGIAGALFTRPSGNVIYQVNCGGGEAAPFTADGLNTGGTAYSSTAGVTTSGVTTPAPATVYQTERYGDFTYTLTGLSAGGTYTVRLHLAEIYFTAAGSRVFNVSINGQPVLVNFDIFVTAGGANKALVEQFQAAATAGGQIVVRFISVTNFAKCNGLEVLQGPAGVDEGRWSRAPFTDISRIPNPVTRSVLIRMLQKDGLEMYDLAGNPVQLNRVRENRIYFIGIDRQAVRKIVVIR